MNRKTIFGRDEPRTFIGLLNFKEPLGSGFLSAFVGLLVWVEDEGELTISVSYFLFGRRCGEIEDGAILPSVNEARACERGAHIRTRETHAERDGGHEGLQIVCPTLTRTYNA